MSVSTCPGDQILILFFLLRFNKGDHLILAHYFQTGCPFAPTRVNLSFLVYACFCLGGPPSGPFLPEILSSSPPFRGDSLAFQPGFNVTHGSSLNSSLVKIFALCFHSTQHSPLTSITHPTQQLTVNGRHPPPPAPTLNSMRTLCTWLSAGSALDSKVSTSVWVLCSPLLATGCLHF